MGSCRWLRLIVFITTTALTLCAQERDPCTTKQLVADDKYCDKYWQCVDGEPIQRDCPNGLVFAGENQGILDGCDYPWKSNYCEPPKIEINPPIPSKNCKTAYGVFEHIVPCSRYWTCWNGTATEQFCGGDLWYSNISHTCEDTDNVKNCKENIFPQSNDDYYYDDNDEAVIYTEKRRFRVVISSLSICSEHYPYNDSCEKYWHCNNGWPRIKKCLDGLVFDRNSSVCVMPPTEDCESPSAKSKPTSSEEEEEE